MRGRFLFLATTLALSGCGGGGGYTRSPVITPQVLDCGPAGLASVKVWSPEAADLTFQGRTHALTRDINTKGAYYKAKNIEYANRGAFGLIRSGGTTHRCDFRPRDLEPETQDAPPGRLDVTPYL